MTTSAVRSEAYGQTGKTTVVDRFGVWLGARAVTRSADFSGARFADLGCGYHARLASSQLPVAQSALLVDVALDPALKADPKVTVSEGSLPDVLADVESGAFDIVLCLSVLEHLWEPHVALRHIRRMLAPGGVAILNVPSWSGKVALEFAAFRLGVSPAAEMNDHKSYYDPRDLWPMLVRAGFRPQHISCHRHKFGLNTSAICRTER